MGRKALPAEIHKAKGTYRPGKHGSGSLPLEIPATPPGMSAVALRYWRSLSKKLFDAGVLADIDGLSLRLLVESIAIYLQALEEIENSGLIVQTSNGTPVQNPAIGIRNKALQQINKLAAEFGMSPTARNCLHLPTVTKSLSTRIPPGQSPQSGGQPVSGAGGPRKPPPLPPGFSLYPKQSASTHAKEETA